MVAAACRTLWPRAGAGLAHPIAPSDSLEGVEPAAAQRAVREGRIESQLSLAARLEALARHLVTIALGGGFRPDDLLREVRDTIAYERLSDGDWRWRLAPCVVAGDSLIHMLAQRTPAGRLAGFF